MENLNSRFAQETKKVISATGKFMALNLNGCYKCEGKDFETLAKQFHVDAAELEAELKLLKSKKCGEHTPNFPPTSVPYWLEWLSKFQRSSNFAT